MEEKMHGQATQVKTLQGWIGDARLFKLSPPYDGNEYVIVSAVIADGIPETYIFQANQDGEVEIWGEIDGSIKGVLSHADALAGAGYKIIPASTGPAPSVDHQSPPPTL